MRKAVFFVWDHIFVFACVVAFATSFIFGCASAPVQTEIVVGPVTCKGEGTFFRCTGPRATWRLEGRYLVPNSEEFGYYAPPGWTPLEVYAEGWGVQLWVRRNGYVTEFSKGPK